MKDTPADPIRYLTAQWILPVSSEPIEWGFLAIQGERIQAVGRYGDLAESPSIPIPEPGSLITPGFINTHVHLEQSFPTPILKLKEESFVDWLLGVIEKTRSPNQPEAKFNRCLTGAKEALRSGTTFVSDIASGPESVEALKQTGLRGIVSLEVFHPGFEEIRIEHWLSTYQNLQAACGSSSKLQVSLSPHSLYNVSPKAWQALQAALNPPLTHTHVAEFEAETDYLAGKPSAIEKLHQQVLGKTFKPEIPENSPIQALIRHRLLETPTLIAHAIHTTESDRKTLTSLPVGLAHCPRSNLALHGKTLNWEDWQSLGIPVGLGTDGRLSTANLDLRDEARCAIQQHGWTEREAFYALTLGGAKALRMGHDIGSLEPGKLADLVVWHVSRTASGLSPETLLLNPGTSVSEVIVGGESQHKGESA